MDPFTLTTYNVHCFPWTSPAIRNIVAWIVLHSGTDIVALQEIWCRHDEWSAAFAAHGWTFARPAREGHIATLFGSGLATAWPAAKWRLTDSRFYPFLEACGLDQLTAKGWFRTELQQRHTGATLRLINTHMQADYDIYAHELHHITEALRYRQVAQLVSAENISRIPTLVVGDMNTNICRFPAGWLSGPGAKGDITFPSTGECLDHCAALGPSAGCWTVNGFHVSHIDLSDHYPVSWLLRWSTSSQESAQAPLPIFHQ